MPSTYFATIAGFDTIRTLPFNSIAASYNGIGVACTTPAKSVLIQNLTDATLWFSFDGTNAAFPLLSYAHVQLDVGLNNADLESYNLHQGTTVFVKRFDVPTSGAVYVLFMHGVAT